MSLRSPQNADDADVLPGYQVTTSAFGVSLIGNDDVTQTLNPVVESAFTLDADAYDDDVIDMLEMDDLAGEGRRL
jgi:hypothetical protein